MEVDPKASRVGCHEFSALGRWWLVAPRVPQVLSHFHGASHAR
jgi:hypothetical protein